MLKKAFLLSSLLIAAASAQKHLETHGVWHVFKSEGVCFASTQPESSQGQYTSRGDIYLMVTFRPQEKVAGEFSTTIGYTFQKGSIPQVVIDQAESFDLFAQGGAAWAEEDQPLIEAMKKGGQLVLSGTSSKGTATTDTYSLKGFSKAFEGAKKACKM